MRALPLFATCVLWFPSAGLSQDSQSALSGVMEAYRSIEGTEVQIKGAVGTMFGDTIWFADATGHYKVILDAGRDARRTIDGCELSLFEPESSPCQIEGQAELTVNWDSPNIPTGLEVLMNIYELKRLH